MAFDALHPETQRWLNEFKSKIRAHATPALAQADTHVMCVIDPSSPALPPGFLPADAATRYTAGIKGEVADEPIVLVLPRDWVAPLAEVVADAMDRSGQDGAAFRRAFRAPPQPHFFRVFVVLGLTFQVINVHRTEIHALAGEKSLSGGAEMARAAMPLIAGLNTSAAVILDDSPAALALRAALDLHGDDALHGVDRTRLLDAMDAGEFWLEYEEMDLRLDVPAEGRAVFVMHRGGTWTGYYLDGGLYEISDVNGETETNEACAQAFRAGLN